VCDWLGGVLSAAELPAREMVAAAFVREDLLALSRAAGAWFRRALAGTQHRQTVHQGAQHKGAASWPADHIRDWRHRKSTLLAKVLLDAIGEDVERALLVGHLDMDDPTLDPQRPHTLLIELARQLGAHRPTLKEQAEGVMQQIRERGDLQTSVLEGRYSESVLGEEPCPSRSRFCLRVPTRRA
jgi:hypothetical protein